MSWPMTRLRFNQWRFTASICPIVLSHKLLQVLSYSAPNGRFYINDKALPRYLECSAESPTFSKQDVDLIKPLCECGGVGVIVLRSDSNE